MSIYRKRLKSSKVFIKINFDTPSKRVLKKIKNSLLKKQRHGYIPIFSKVFRKSYRLKKTYWRDKTNNNVNYIVANFIEMVNYYFKVVLCLT